LLAFSGLFVNGIEAADFNDDAEEEASTVDDFVICLRSNHSGRSRTQPRKKLPDAPPRGFRPRPENFLSAARNRTPAGFSQQDLYRFQEVYRL
jgi:hypothetical protein